MRILIASILFALAFLAGCGGQTPSATSGEKVNLTLFTWTKPEELQINQDLVNEFMQENPNISVELINEPSRRAMDKLQSMIAARSAPDVMSIHGAYFIPLADKGALLDLGTYAEAQDFDLQDFYPQLVDLCRWNGKLYSLPRYTSVYVLFYNKDLFDAAGIKYPDATWTWDTYLAAAKKMTKRAANGKQQFGTLIQFWGARLYPWIWQNNGNIITPDRKKCTFDSPETRGALQFLTDLRYKHKVTPATNPANPDQDLTMFTSGQVAMIITGAWDIQAFHNTPGLHWDIAPLPRQKQPATLLGMENYAISTTTKHPKESWELFKFLLGKQSQSIMGEKLEKQPSRQSVANESYLTAKAPYNRKVFVEALNYAKIAPNVPNWERIRPYIDQPLEKVWLGKMTVNKATAQICKDVNRELGKK